MIEILVGIVLLGGWHAVLVRLGAVAPWARSAIRVTLGLGILAETGRFLVLESLPWRTRGAPPHAMQEALGRSMEAAFWLDTAVATALGLAAGGLLVLTGLWVWRARRQNGAGAPVRGPEPNPGASQADPPASGP